MNTKSFRHLGLERFGSVLRLELKRADGRNNAIVPAFLEELETALAEVAAGDLGLLLITGGGRVFSTGVDLGVVESLPSEEAEDFFRRGRTLVRKVLDLGLITVAAVNGLALGGGFELALACDIRWAHSRTAFGFPESHRGLVPGWGGVGLLCRHLSRSRAMEMLATGDYIGARAAHEAGLVSRLFHGRDFDRQVRDAAIELGGRPPKVLQALKRLSRTMGFSEEAVALEAEVFSNLWSTRQADRFMKALPATFQRTGPDNLWESNG
ncbi:MAG: enoyl-CoA hydratase/isomerase family protein [Desulfuromonadales bacterium]